MDFLKELGIEKMNPGACCGPGAWAATEGRERIASINPTTGETIAEVAQASAGDYEQVLVTALEGFKEWRMIPAPKRGLIVRDLGEALRAKKEALGKLVTLEMGKIIHEGWGEVQEMIDICDFALGLSRQLYGLTMHSERPKHRMYEQWHPLGVVGVISAFNFPVAVWCWNTALAVVCGDSVIWKPSDKTPITAIACQHLFEQAMAEFANQLEKLKKNAARFHLPSAGHYWKNAKNTDVGSGKPGSICCIFICRGK